MGEGIILSQKTQAFLDRISTLESELAAEKEKVAGRDAVAEQLHKQIAESWECQAIDNAQKAAVEMMGKLSVSEASNTQLREMVEIYKAPSKCSLGIDSPECSCGECGIKFRRLKALIAVIEEMLKEGE